MNKVICQLALLLAAVSLAGCGLKGPLYFPEDVKAKSDSVQTTPSSSSASSAGQPATAHGQSAQPVQ